jgi:hypothetical protein
VGAAVSAGVAVWLVPLSGPRFRQTTRERWRAALAEGKQAQIATEQRVIEEFRAARQPV